MCGRYFLAADGAALAARFGLAEVPPWTPRYNLAPGQALPVLRLLPGGRRLDRLQWGLVPHWMREPGVRSRPINARAETVGERPLFRDAWRRGQRCLVPASGFYEWDRGHRPAQPWAIAAEDGDLLAFAGLWDRWLAPGGGRAGEFRDPDTVGRASGGGAPSSACPVLVPPHHERLWLEGPPAAAEALLALGHEVALRAWPVSTRVNAVREEGPELIRPLPGAPDSTFRPSRGPKLWLHLVGVR
ncbi:MAG: SOS response-associated peptidase [Xanthomonadales bacterium]|nr:SOS response-associated peptidase [Xanthomonadales bacterium]